MVETALAIAATSPVGIALVNRISDAVGWYFVPRQIVRRAEAEAQAELIRVRAEESAAEIDIDKLIERAEFRSTIEKIVQQTNFEAIIAKALLQLSDGASPDKMDQDWLWNFFDRCRYVSDDDMQEMWAKILAGEANLSGSYSRRSVNIMGDFDTHAAAMFSTYCRFIGVLGERHATPFVVTGGGEELNAVYQDQGLTYNALAELADLGLISTGFNPMSVLVHQRIEGVPDPVKFSYEGQSALMPCPDGRVIIGITALTSTGRQLAQLCLPAEPVEGFYEFIVDRWDSLCKVDGIIGGGGTVFQYVECRCAA